MDRRTVAALAYVVASLGIGLPLVAAETCPTDRFFRDSTSGLFLLFPTVTTVFEPWPESTGPQDVGPFELDLFAPELMGVTTVEELIADIRGKVSEDYCEFDVAVLAGRDLDDIPPAYARRATVGIGSDAKEVRLVNSPEHRCWAFGLSGPALRDDLAVTTARVFVGSYRKRHGGEDAEPLDCRYAYEPPEDEDPAALAGDTSTAARWAHVIAGTAAHEGGHLFGLPHDRAITLRSGEDSNTNHVMADSVAGLDIEIRATRNRHFSDLSYSLLAANVGLSASTLHNWDFVNPNDKVARGLGVKVNARSETLTTSWAFSGPESPWGPPEIIPGGEETFRGTTYKIYFLRWMARKPWSGGPDGEVGPGRSFHVGLSFFEKGPIIIRDVVLLGADGRELALHPRMPGYDEGAMKIKSGSFVVDLFNTTSADGPLVVSDVVVRLLPRMVDLESMMRAAPQPRSRDGLPVLPWRTIQLPAPVVLASDQPLELPVAALAEPRFVDLTNPGCGAFDDGGEEDDGCLRGRALGLFPATYVYLTAKVTDPDALHWDPAAGRLVRGPVDSFLFYQVKGIVPDCNHNGRDDLLDIADGSSRDANGNGAADECEGLEADLVVGKTASSATVVAGQPLSYVVTVANLGPDAANGVSLTDVFSPALTGATWSCGSEAGSGDLQSTFDLAPGDSAVCTVAATVLTTFFGPLRNVARAFAPPDVTALEKANDEAMVETLVFPPTGVVATKEASGPVGRGGTVGYRVLLLNGNPVSQSDNPGDELVDTLPPELVLLGASASSGTVGVDVALRQVTWNGSIAAGGVVEIAIQARVGPGVAVGTVVANQATVFFDSDGNGTNDTSTLSDDPAQSGSTDPTTFAVVGILEVPTLSAWGMWILAAALMLLAPWWLARRGSAR